MCRFRSAMLLGCVLALSVFGASACTSSDPLPDAETRQVTYPRTERGVIDSLANYLNMPPENLNYWSPSAKEAACAAERLASRVGAKRMIELGYDPNDPTLVLDYSDEERAAAINVLVGCIKFEEAVLSLVSSSQKLPLEASSCISRGYERLNLTRDLATAMVTGNEPDPLAQDARYSRSVGQLLLDCMGVDDLLPNAPLPRLPGGIATTTTVAANGGETTTTEASTTTVADSGGLNGIEPGSPLDSGK